MAHRRFRVKGYSKDIIFPYNTMDEVRKIMNVYLDKGYVIYDLGDYLNVRNDFLWPKEIRGVYIDDVLDDQLSWFKSYPPYDYSLDYFKG